MFASRRLLVSFTTRFTYTYIGAAATRVEKTFTLDQIVKKFKHMQSDDVIAIKRRCCAKRKPTIGPDSIVISSL